MDVMPTLRGAALALAVACAALPAAAQDGDPPTTTADDVRAEIAEAMDAIAAYSGQERDQALAEAREALTRLDAAIENREEALRENWADMSEEARAAARDRLSDLRRARNRLGERYGALESGATDAWDELKSGFSDAWTAFSETWEATDEDASAD